jgi:hypothetical protein
MSSVYYNALLTEHLKGKVITEYLDKQKDIQSKNEVFEDYNAYIASYEYAIALNFQSLCEDIEAYNSAGGNYYELILFNFNELIMSFNYKKYIYLRFYNNIRSDVYYSLTNSEDDIKDTKDTAETSKTSKINITNLVSVVKDSKCQEVFTNIYTSKETYLIFYKIITKRIKEAFTINNYYRNKIKHPYTYKSNIYNYICKDMIYDYTSILDKHILLSPCEYDDAFLDIISIRDIIPSITPNITTGIYSIDFETFVDLSFIIKYYAEHFSRDGSKTLHTFYSGKMPNLVIPELYKTFLANIKNSKSISDLYEKNKDIYGLDVEVELRYLSKDLSPNISGLEFICRCNYVYNLWQLIFTNNKHYYNHYPDKKIIAKINKDIITEYNMEKMICI